MALVALPDEVKQRVWRLLGARELCRLASVSRAVCRGANADAVWKTRTQELLAAEQSRLAVLRPPVECALRRQDARRDLMISASPSQRIAGEQTGGCLVVRDDDTELLAEDSAFWRLWYRDCYVTVRTFEAADAAFEAAKSELLELRRERGELKELLQAAKSKNQSEKHARRVHMSCVRWMNRSHRRQTASTSLLSAQSAAMSKAELSAELQQVESAIQVQSTMLFSLRSQYQKGLHRMTTQLARGTKMLRDLGLM